MNVTILSEVVLSMAFVLGGLIAVIGEPLPQAEGVARAISPDGSALHREVPDDPPGVPSKGPRSPAVDRVRGRFVSVQVNIDAEGNNIFGDAANEPSIAIDPTDPQKIVIGWRQFDTVESNFRQAGWAYSHNAGQSWTFPGVLEPGVFRSDPVLAADTAGNIHYYSLTILDDLLVCDLFTSTDGGLSWNAPVYGFGGDKAWMAIDLTNGPGRDNIYASWTLSGGCCGRRQFTRSTDGGQTFDVPISVREYPEWGTLSVGPDGELYLAGDGFLVAKSTNAQNPETAPTFDFVAEVDLGGLLPLWSGPNPNGLGGQAWVATSHSAGPDRGNVYLLASARQRDTGVTHVMFSRSTDGGLTWSEAIRINDDAPDTDAWHWFGTMSVAPGGRIDAVWNDTRNSGNVQWSELYYAFSGDAGLTWSENIPVSPMFDSWVGWPNQSKIGDYYDMISDDGGVNVAYAATFNDEQDVYFVRIMPDCNGNGVADIDDVTGGESYDCDADFVPDECELDFDGDGAVDGCDPDMDNDGVENGADVCNFTPPEVPVTADGRPAGDVDANCVADLRDWPSVVSCLSRSGPGVPHNSPDCIAALDIDGDTDVDFDDVAEYLNAFTQCGFGAGDTDDDGDGVANCIDQCPGADDTAYAPGCAGQIPTVSEWGLIIMALLLLTAGKIHFGGREACYR